MTPEQTARIALGWTRKRLAHESGVGIASIYLLERMQTAGADEDARIREALVFGMMERWNNSQRLLVHTRVQKESDEVEQLH